MVSFKGSTILLFSVACSCFSDRSWSFVVPVVLSRTCEQSTFFSSIYSFAELVFIVVVTPLIAPKLSAFRRITVYRVSIILQNVLTALACFVLALLVQLFMSSTERFAEDGRVYSSRSDWRFVAAFTCLCIAGGLSAVFSTFAKVLLSKDMLLHAVRKEAATSVVADHSTLTYEDNNSNNDGDDVPGTGSSDKASSSAVPMDALSTENNNSNNNDDGADDNNEKNSSDSDVTKGSIIESSDGYEDESLDEKKPLSGTRKEGSEDEESGSNERSLYDSQEFKLAYDVGLAQANKMFSLIDLSMAVCAPILIGLMCDDVFWKTSASAFDGGDSDSKLSGLDKAQLRLLRNTMFAALFVGVWNALSCIPETLLPSYAKRKYALDALDQPQDPTGKSKDKRKKIVDFGAFRALFRQPTLLALFSFAMLYVSILTPNSSPLVAYLVGSRGFSSLYISLFAAGSQLLGMAGLQVPPPLVKRRWRVTSIQMLGLFIQIALLSITMVAFAIDYVQYYLGGTTIATTTTTTPFTSELGLSSSSSHLNSDNGSGFGLIYCALTGIAASRFGLWLADNAFNLMLQKTVPEKDIANVNSALQSLYSMWSSVALIISIFTPVSMFIVVTTSSYGIVFISVVLFLIYWIMDMKGGSSNNISVPEDEFA